MDMEKQTSDRGMFVREEDRDEMKTALREALREWLDEKYAQFGKWSLHGLLAAGLGAIVWFILSANGWHKGP